MHYFRRSALFKVRLFFQRMKYLSLFLLVLVLSGIVALGQVPRTVTAHEDGGIARVVNMTSQTSADSNAVEVDNIRFEIIIPQPVLTIPKKQPDAYTPVYVGLRIINSNYASIPLRFSNFFIPQLAGSDGQLLERGGGGDATVPRLECDFPIVIPGLSVTFFINGRLVWRNNTLQIELNDRPGHVLPFYDLKPGTYQLRLAYSPKSETAEVYDVGGSIYGRTIKGVWTGEAITPFVEVYIVPS